MKNNRIAGLTAAPILLSASGFASEPSNVVFIITDQQSYYLISAISNSLGSEPYGGNSYFKTPNLDRLVKSGYTFSNCYAGSPISVPSRFALFTGESPNAYGVKGNISPKGDRITSLTRTRAMGTLFRNAGYNTYYAGKTHLPWAAGNPGSKAMFEPPTAYGFDNYLSDNGREVLAEKGAEFFAFHQGKEPFLLVLSFINPHDICQSNLLFGDKQLEDFPEETWETRRNQFAYRDIYQSMDSALFEDDRLAELPFNVVPTEGFPLGKIGRNNFTASKMRAHRWFYYRLVEQVDREIGQVLDALEKSPYKDNTLLVFTSDHGDMAGSHGLIGKVLPYEESQRVPLIFVGKGISQGVIDHTTPVNNGWDLLPTMLEMAGIAKPGELKGVSLYGTITEGKPVDRNYLYFESPKSYGVVENGRYKYIRFMPSKELVGGDEVLFDLEKDRGELHNLAGDASCAPKIAALRQVLIREMESRGIPNPWDVNMN